MARNWTTKEIDLLKQLASEGKDRFEIAEILGRSYSSVKTKAYNMGLKIANYNMYKGRIFSMYKKGEIVVTGTIGEIAEFQGVDRRSIEFYMSRNYIERTSDNAMRFVDVTGSEGDLQ